MYTLQQIAEITNTTFVGRSNNKIHHFLNDSRSLQSPEDSIFIALKTSRNNGHAYIPGMVEAGVRSFLIQSNEFNPIAYKDYDVSFIVSDDPLHTIQQLAAYHRQQFSIPVIGITGSNGKTVVKEWLYQLLKNNFIICRSPKSYNSQIGVPLSVLNLNANHSLAIFEAGISQAGEMEKLASIIRPTIGVLTSVGTAHDEGFQGKEQKLAEKLKLLEGCETQIINGLNKEGNKNLVSDRALFISDHESADLNMSFESGILKLVSPSTTYAFSIPFSDAASVQNSASCVAVLLKLGLSENDIAEKLMGLQAVALRLEIKNGINNTLVINDYYNSDLDSLKIALNYLQQQNRRAKKIMIVSDIEQSGISANMLYREVADLVASHKIDLLIGIGKDIGTHKPFFKANSIFFSNTAAFLEQFNRINYHFSEATILLKGARSFGFENVSRLLQLKSHDTVFEINLNKITENINYYRSVIGNKVQVMCMVKAMGYGSGSVEIAKTLQHIGVNYLAVAYADEGVELRQSQVSLPIMVMNPEEDAFEDIINYQLEPEIYSFKVLQSFVNRLDALGISEPYPIHLKIDTGMHRLGFEEFEIEKLVSKLKALPQLRVKSIFSHLVGTDNPDLDGFTQTQMNVFEKAAQHLEKGINYPTIKHLCNSAGITRFKAAHYNMVRLGIGMYGIGVTDAEQNNLENVGTLKTRISQIKTVQAGETIGYNRNGKVEKQVRIATIPIGYADGFGRLLGNGKHGVYIKNTFCKTLGNICMDMCMVDVTNVGCEEGDDVIVFENTIQINALADAINSIPYEVLTNVSGRVKRVYVQE